MRITSEQIFVIKSTLSHFLKKEKYKLYLYGSRTQDHLLGGDIDLLVVTTVSGLEILNQNKYEVLVHMKKNKDIGQRRIDLKYCIESDLSNDPFLKSIKDGLHEL